MSVMVAAREGDQTDLLESMRDRLSPVVLDPETNTRELASLSQRLLEILRDLDDGPESRKERRELLGKMRVRVATAVDRADTPIRDLAALSRRLLDIAEDIATLDQLSGESDPIAHAVKIADDGNVKAPALYAKARYVVPPENMVTTEWPSICEICRVLGIGFDDWQDDLGRLILAKRPDGLYASDTTTISIPRQSGKTYLIGAIVFALCIKYPGLRCIWTAHLFKTARETFESMQGLADMPSVKPYIKRIYSGSGDEKIIFTNGSVIMFGARERGFGRGFPNIGVLIFDEAQILTSKALDDMTPSTNVAKNPLILTMGTPPKPDDPSEFFSTQRIDAGIEVDEDDVSEFDDDVPRESLYVEFSADRGCDPSDRAQWLKAIPAFPNRVTERAVRRMRKILGEASFLREGLGIWDRVVKFKRIIPKSLWASAIDLGPESDALPSAIGVDMSHSRELSISAAWALDNGRVHVEEVWSGFDISAGKTWLAETSKRIDILIDSASPAAAMLPDLLAKRCRARQTTAQDMAKACGAWLDSIDSELQEDGLPLLTHGGQESVTRAVSGAKKRPIRDAGGFGWDRSDDAVNIAPLVSGSLALLGATTKGPRKRTTRKAVY
ncbi:terminase large subunit domain-containing protein [Mycobacteroides chelonae]|jgi:hypothetical protein|uniref:terminase large subunit domain-containing protein n=1 Tax=Mycobacteroides chelonae TaxID=1774 RepID=UPI0008A996F2|nr:terminase family protein [Mycobacteroides chelonae]MBF9326019.1 terminase [Mycobacteroides chelonae]MBF9420195.1 terminase [Mycobacteroides chelonae]MBF9438663.1 terminase [Mycobacteroides chelonae]MBV6359972.1 terminase [Mycobacteroides chelonae]MEC4834425.1 terminase [Mycobacteroides chelonae]